MALGDARDDGAGLLGVAGPVHGRAAGLQRGLELEQVLVEPAQGVVLDRRTGDAQLLPVVDLGDDGGALGPDRAGRVREVRRSWVLPSAARAASGKAGIPTNVALMTLRRAGNLDRSVLGPAPAAASRSCRARGQRDSCALVGAASTSARCITRTPARCRDRSPPTCIRHELSPATITSAPVSRTCAALSAPIATDVSGFFTAKVPPKPQHSSAAGRSPGGCPRTAREQPRRAVADAEHPQRVAGRVIGHPVREVGAHVLHAEDVDEELAQLVDDRGDVRGRPVDQRRIAGPRATSACWWRTDPTHEPDGAMIAS